MRHKACPEQTPQELLERARVAGKTVDLELYLASKALGTLDPAHPERFIAINVSATTIASPALAKLIPEGMSSRLVIELTDHDTAMHHESVKDAIQSLKSRAWVAVNSAGAGVSGLQALVDLAPDIVKIERDFLAGLAEDPARRALLKALVQFADETGVTLIALGVETRDDLQALRDLGVRFAQGYVFGQPAQPSCGTRPC
jgi:EAL domain-containing protein (putative c-di-GMP-specific phosphodiesterase class I)